MATRVVGDLAPDPGLRQLGGLLSVIAIALYAAVVALVVITARRSSARRVRGTRAAPGPQPALLRNEPDLRVLIAGLELGGRIPPHSGPLGVFHFLTATGS